MERKNYKERLKNITTFIFDVDGVFTNTQVFVNNDGDLLRSMNMNHRFAVKTAIAKGYTICIITGGGNVGVQKRFENLGVKDIFMLRHQKLETFLKYQKEKHLKREQILYMGDDMPDIPPMKRAGLAICPVDAVPEVRAVSDYISHLEGGQGAVRDIIEQVLKVRGDWTFEDK